jgi:amphi-Trp domain-containing protein
MSQDTFFKFESVQDLDSIIAYLEAVRDGFAGGELRFAHKDRELLFKPQGLIGFLVEAKIKGERRKLTLKFGWKEHGEASAAPQDPLLISGGRTKGE